MVDTNASPTARRDGEPDLGDDYIVPNAKIVRIQLARGGIRLAKVLNDAFGGDARAGN
jgi:hypothetical protein